MKSPALKIVGIVAGALALAFVAAAIGQYLGRPAQTPGGTATTQDEAAQAASRAMTFTQPEQPSK